MEGYLGQIEAWLKNIEGRVAAVERAAGDSLAKAREDLAAEKYAAENPNETPEIAAAKKALADHVAETTAKQAVLDEAIAKQEADAKAAEPEPEPEVVGPEPAKAAELADADETL